MTHLLKRLRRESVSVSRLGLLENQEQKKRSNLERRMLLDITTDQGGAPTREGAHDNGQEIFANRQEPALPGEGCGRED
jgi:hypothetical protein